MTLMHGEITLTHMECSFIPMKNCTTLVSTDVEGLTFEQKEVKIHVWNLTGNCNTFFMFKNHSLTILHGCYFGLVLQCAYISK